MSEQKRVEDPQHPSQEDKKAAKDTTVDVPDAVNDMATKVRPLHATQCQCDGVVNALLVVN